MSVIRINIDAANSSCQSLRESIRKISDIENRLSSLKNSVDARIKARNNISSKLNTVCSASHTSTMDLHRLDTFINKSTDGYLNTENYLKQQALNIGATESKNTYNDKYKNPYDHVLNNYNENIENYNPANEESKQSSEKSWLDKVSDLLQNDILGNASDFLTDVAIPSLAFYKGLPNFKIDGNYLKILNSDHYKGGGGLARWYSINNIKSGKYPNAANLYKLSKGIAFVQKTAKVLSWLSYGATAYDELTTTENISITRKVSNAAVEVGMIAAGAKAGAVAGAVVGAAIGSIVPGIGNVVGGIIGAGAGIIISAGINALTELKLWDGDTKTTKDVIKDAVGDIAEAGVKFVGDCAKGAAKWFDSLFKPKPKTGAISFAG